MPRKDQIPPPRKRGKKDREDIFIARVLEHGNQTRAAREAGYSATTARQVGSRLANTPRIAKLISENKARQLAESDVSAKEVIRAAYEIAMSDVTCLFRDGVMLQPEEWPENIRRCVSGLDVVKRNVTSGDGQQDDVLKLRMWSKPDALKILFQHLGLLKEQLHIEGGLTVRWADSESEEE